MSSDKDVNEEMNSLTAMAENFQHDDKNNDHLKFDKNKFYKDSVKIMQKMQKKLKNYWTTAFQFVKFLVCLSILTILHLILISTRET